MKLRFNAHFDVSEYRKRNVMQSECLVILKHDIKEMDRIRNALYQIVERNDKAIASGKEPLDLDVIIEVVNKKRSQEANRLMWLLYGIIADVLNREHGTRERITPEELYEQDMESWAPRHIFTCPEKSLEFFKILLGKDYGKVKNVEDHGGVFSIEVWQTSSYWDTKQMSEHIDRLLNTLEQMGIIRENSGDLDRIMRDVEGWRKSNG
jgi:hypothetical protein